ncbi:hypothetical protein HMPREF9069_00321 [Atopobium sp. oral taxon 810 str. F0209]|nr:hypothetical protein HMPREF9069_00321 [Atopobium sp. oral taxon 810 str. F0209]
MVATHIASLMLDKHLACAAGDLMIGHIGASSSFSGTAAPCVPANVTQCDEKTLHSQLLDVGFLLGEERLELVSNVFGASGHFFRLVLRFLVRVPLHVLLCLYCLPVVGVPFHERTAFPLGRRRHKTPASITRTGAD